MTDMNNPPLNARLRASHNRNAVCALHDEDVHALVELLDVVEEFGTSMRSEAFEPLARAMRRIRGR